MRKWIFLFIPLLVVWFFLFALSNEPISHAASTSLIKNNVEFGLLDVPPKYFTTTSDITPKGEQIFECSNSPSSNEMNSQKMFEPPIVTNGLLPKVNYKYTYAPSFEGEAQKTYVASINPFVANAVDLMEEEYQGYTYIESANSFDLGIAYSDVFFFSLTYPLKQQTVTIDKDLSYGLNNEIKVQVESTSMTLTTKAGTFENVVVIRYPNGAKLFLAKGFGIIRITDSEGKITTELISRK